MAESRIDNHSGDAASTAGDGEGCPSSLLGELAGGTESQDHAAGRTATAADAGGDGQSQRAQDTGAGIMDVSSGEHALIHPALSVMAEYGRVSSADHQAARAGVSASGDAGTDHRRPEKPGGGRYRTTACNRPHQQ